MSDDTNDNLSEDNSGPALTTDLTVLETIAKHHARTASGRLLTLDDNLTSGGDAEPATDTSSTPSTARTVLDIVPNDPSGDNKDKDRKDPLTNPTRGALPREGSSAGAFAVANSDSLIPPLDPENPSSPPLLQHQASEVNVSAHLVEATLVSGGSPKALDQVVPEAQAVDTEKESFQRKRKWGIFSCLFVVVAVGITVGGFCATGACRASEEDSSNTNVEPASTSIPTLAPSGPPVPTLAPLSEEDLIVKGLPDYSLRDLQNPTSPQSAAYQWLLEDPNLEEYDNDRLLQRFALSTLYYATGGEHWRNRDHWLSYNHSECLWFNREDFQWYPDYNSSEPCYPNTTTYRYLTPWDNRLVGTLPRQISLLTGLINLDFSTSSLVGSIPSQLGRLTNLRKLFFNNNNDLGGPIPSQLAQLTLLDALSLHDMALTGTLPSQFGQLTLLENLWFEFTQVSGTIPAQLCALSNASLWVTYSMVECPADGTCAKSCT